MLTVVLDSNLFVSVVLTPQGESTEVFRRARAQALCVSSYILTEVEKTLRLPRLRKKYPYSDAAIERHLKDIRIFSERIEPELTIEVCPDPKDNAVLACAVEAHADYLVTRNPKHFLRSYASVTVITPKEFFSIAKSNP